MRTLVQKVALPLMLVLAPGLARPVDEGAMPQTAPPQQLPPAPDDVPAPPQAVEPQAPAAVPSGQWVHTSQYGWVWMPYGEAYTYSPPDGWGEPYMYVYYPAFGWTWLAAPWVWGWGPWPYFGVYGAVNFSWYGHGWWRYPHRWHYAPGYRGGYGHYRGGYYGARPAPGRGGAPVYGGGRGHYGARPAPVRGGAPVYRGSASPGGYGRHVGPGGHGTGGHAGGYAGGHAGGGHAGGGHAGGGHGGGGQGGGGHGGGGHGGHGRR